MAVEIHEFREGGQAFRAKLTTQATGRVSLSVQMPMGGEVVFPGSFPSVDRAKVRAEQAMGNIWQMSFTREQMD